MNSNSNSIIYSSNNKEYLFWLIFRNKYLFCKIIKFIQTVEWVIYDDHSKLHIDNRLKLNDIHSLEQMIKNKQYQLLNYKLDNNHYINITPTSITTLFNKLSIQINTNLFINNNSNSNNINNSRSTNNNDEIETLKQLLKKLLLKKRNEFEIIDLTFEAVKCNSLIVLKILKNEPFSKIIYPSTLNYAKDKLYVEIVDEILNKDSSSSSSNDGFNLNEFIINLNIGEFLKIKDQELISNMLYKINNIKKLSETSKNEDYSSKELLYQLILNLNIENYHNDLFLFFYGIYIIKFNEIIDKIHMGIGYIDISDDSQYNNLYQQLRFIQFIKINEMFNINSTLCISNIINDIKNGLLVWNQLLFDIVLNYENDRPIVINDRSIIDWILNCKNNSILKLIYSNFNKITFGTLELADYVNKESGLVNHLINGGESLYNDHSRFIYFKIWHEALENQIMN